VSELLGSGADPAVIGAIADALADRLVREQAGMR